MLPTLVSMPPNVPLPEMFRLFEPVMYPAETPASVEVPVTESVLLRAVGPVTLVLPPTTRFPELFINVAEIPCCVEVPAT